MALTAYERHLRALAAAHRSHANGNRTPESLLKPYLRKVDPEGVLPEDERLKRAWHARMEHMARMRFLSFRSRREKAEATQAMIHEKLRQARGR